MLEAFAREKFPLDKFYTSIYSKVRPGAMTFFWDIIVHALET
jgi:hypothetical protein